MDSRPTKEVWVKLALPENTLNDVSINSSVNKFIASTTLPMLATLPNFEEILRKTSLY